MTLRRHLTPPYVIRVTFRAVSAMVGTTQTPDSFQGFFFMRTMRFNTLGFLLVLIGGFSPFPYKITCLGSGIIGVNFYIFFISSLLSRGLRFFLVGYFFYKFNSLAKYIVNKYINIISSVLVAASFIYLIFFRN